MKTIISLIFIAAAVCVTIFFTIPQHMCEKATCSYDGIKAINKNKESYIAALASAQNLESRRADLTNRYNAITPDDRIRLEELLPNNVDNIKLVLELETLAKKYGLLIESPKLETNIAARVDTAANSQGQAIRTVDNSPASLPYGTFTLEFTVRAKYENIKALISDMERNLRLIELSAITVKVPNSDISTAGANKNKVYPKGTYDVNIRAVIYYLKN